MLDTYFGTTAALIFSSLEKLLLEPDRLFFDPKKNSLPKFSRSVKRKEGREIKRNKVRAPLKHTF